MTSLDASTAAKMVKGLDEELVKELAVEVSYLDAAGRRGGKEAVEFAREFCSALNGKQDFQLKEFLKGMLDNTVGPEKTGEIEANIQELLQQRDPFIAIRTVGAKKLAAVLGQEHPQAVAVVLSELDAKQSSEVLNLLDEGLRLSAVSRMTRCESVSPEAKSRIAQSVCKRIETVASESGEDLEIGPEKSLRKVAIILRKLGKQVRDGLLNAIKEKDKETAEKVSNLMITWEDIVVVEDRSLQGALRGIEAVRLALALVEADEEIANKIKANISERAGENIDEETSLMSAPQKESIDEARDEIVSALRDLNVRGELTFVE